VKPSGEQYELKHGANRVVVTQVGAGLREWEGVLAGYAAARMAHSGRGQVQIPRQNRVEKGKTE